MTRATVLDIRSRLQALLNREFPEYAISMGNAHFRPADVSFRDLSFVERSAVSGGRPELDWNLHHRRLGLDPSWFGKTFRDRRGIQMKITGIAPSRRRFPVMAVRADGADQRTNLFPVEYVKSQLTAANSTATANHAAMQRRADGRPSLEAISASLRSQQWQDDTEVDNLA